MVLRYDPRQFSFSFLVQACHGDDQPVDPEVQLRRDPVVQVVNPPVRQNEKENVAQPQELEVFVFQSLLDASWYTSLSVASFRFFFLFVFPIQRG